MMRRKLIALTAAGLTIGTAAPTQAQVFIDPDSPTAREYEIPLEGARREAAGGGDDPVEQGARDAPIFGEGVGPDSGDGSSGSSGSNDRSNGGGGKDGSTPQDETVGASGGGTVAGLGNRPVVATVPQGGIGDTMTIGAVALSVLLLGGVIGSIARRRTV